MDADGNQYPIKTYGKTVWMAENLRVTQDRLGNAITYYFPNDDASNAQAFGLLYDFETACKVCPDGWSLPGNEAWSELFQLSENNLAARYKDSQFWEGEENANSSMFSARPAGFGNNAEHDNQFQAKTLFWSNTKEDDHFVWAFILAKGIDTIRSASQHPTYAFSVRCIKSSP